MEIKGRITKAGPLETRQRKNDGSDYSIFELRVQIGLYEREVANYQTHEFTKTTEADELSQNYFHDAAREAAQKYRKGEVVMVTFHHYVNQYGRTETVIDKVEPVNEQQAQQAAPAPAPKPAPQQAPADKGDDLPF